MKKTQEENNDRITDTFMDKGNNMNAPTIESSGEATFTLTWGNQSLKFHNIEELKIWVEQYIACIAANPEDKSPCFVKTPPSTMESKSKAEKEGLMVSIEKSSNQDTSVP